VAADLARERTCPELRDTARQGRREGDLAPGLATVGAAPDATAARYLGIPLRRGDGDTRIVRQVLDVREVEGGRPARLPPGLAAVRGHEQAAGFGGHDQPRVVGRVDGDGDRAPAV